MSLHESRIVALKQDDPGRVSGEHLIEVPLTLAAGVFDWLHEL